MKRFITALAVLTAACSSGYRGGVALQALSDGGIACPTDAGTCVAVSPLSALADACRDDRWIAILTNPASPCPGAGGGVGGTWAVSKLFDIPGSPVPMPASLRPYCLYEWQPSTPGAPADLSVLASIDADTTARRPDCLVGAPMGSSAAVDAGWRTLQDNFHDATGWLSSLPRSALVAPAEVRVAVVDSSPHSYDGGTPADDRSGHGESVGWIIREHACPSSSPGSACIGQIADHLALPRITPRVKDTANGGFFGYQTELAKAIHAAVADWRAYNSTTIEQPRLVVNLSVAWDPRFGGEFTVVTDLEPPVRAVYEAIKHARCWGAAVIAAAGNDPGGPTLPTGPMYPAGWETKPAPTLADCQASEGPSYPQPPAGYPVFPKVQGLYDPMVFAAGGTRADDRELANARIDGRPRIAAPGAFAVAEEAGGPTQVLTGSSASSAVTSSIAAVIWGYRPSLTAPEVIDLIRQSSVDLGLPADFCLGGLRCPLAGDPRVQIARVSLRDAIRAACATPLERCPPTTALPSPASRRAYSGATPVFSAAEVAEVEAHVTVTASGTSLTHELPPLPVCRHSAFLTSSTAYPSTVCPLRQYYGKTIRPWTGPQPGSNPCPACWLLVDPATTKGTVYLSIDTSFSASTLYEPVLRLNDTYDIDLKSVGALSGGDVAKVVDVDLSGVSSVKSATVSFRAISGAESFSTTSELFLQ